MVFTRPSSSVSLLSDIRAARGARPAFEVNCVGRAAVLMGDYQPIHPSCNLLGYVCFGPLPDRQLCDGDRGGTVLYTPCSSSAVLSADGDAW